MRVSSSVSGLKVHFKSLGLSGERNWRNLVLNKYCSVIQMGSVLVVFLCNCGQLLVCTQKLKSHEN